jgi:acyl-CoA dehydrogenase
MHKVAPTIRFRDAPANSQDTPPPKRSTQVRSHRLVHGPDEMPPGRNVIKAFREHGTTASAAGDD